MTNDADDDDSTMLQLADDIAESVPDRLHDLAERRERHERDEQGRQTVNAHGDLDVPRTRRSNYPLAVPLERGDVLTLDHDELGGTYEFRGFRGDCLKMRDLEEEYGVLNWGVHSFNSACRDASSLTVEEGDVRP